MDSSDLCFLPLTKLCGLLRDRDVSPVEATQAVLARIGRLEPGLHAYLAVLAEPALARRDRRRGRDRRRPSARLASRGTGRGEGSLPTCRHRHDLRDPRAPRSQPPPSATWSRDSMPAG